ncbi:ExbD/TolR family protein [Paraburkholderia dinghuensis]|uniref:Biopolymer transporter ExbD n=1 Tax=Paraburkholderia dinghuensis TaxID=2305225 RepID=A0A3N6N0Y1_9BURK|nr:biopolymer transporter ExbD [Paraburkholderia dinghuensis]RQH01147.1 biopolymer transporter ExbD [Paraburkholderia dinghuensis]
MAMTGPFGDDAGDDTLMNEINMTPLVDVMLVLLIVFMVTIPAMQHALKIDLPHVASQPVSTAAQHVDVGVAADGSLLWNGEHIAEDALATKLLAAAAAKPQPELRLHADRNVRYERVADVMARAHEAGITQLGFLTDPQRRP